jgi:phosphoglycolate phosphatase
MHYHAVLFDLDGTLLNTLADLADSGNWALGQLGFAEHPTAAYKYFVGDGMENLVRRAIPAGRSDAATVARGAALVREAYSRRWAEKTRPYAGIPELLDALVAREMPMAVLSNKPDDFTHLCVEKLLPRWAFATIVGARASLARKPDPAGALMIAERLGLAPAEILYLGDTNTDMQTAVAAGMFPVGALWGFRAAEELTASGARRLIERPAQLLELV